MTADQLDRAFRAADPTRTDDSFPSVDATVHAARTRADGRPVATRPRLGRAWMTAGVAVAAAVVLAVGVPLLNTRSAPTAQATIRLVPFTGLMAPWVLETIPAGLTAVGYTGAQGSTTAAYVAPNPQTDSVYVSHTAAPVPPRNDDVAHVDASRQLSDGSQVTVSGYGRFAQQATVTALLGMTSAAPETSPLQMELAPSDWQLAAFKGLEPGTGVVTVTPDGTLESPEQISVIRYRTTAADFPAGYMDPGPTSSLISRQRPGTLMQGSQGWTLQLRLDDGGSMILLLPIGMDRERVQQFADGVTTPTA